ncbi:MAG: T9SS type A sorting domain-containing protein, partial [Chitinophagaceae bacterium]|nr:T9SS type A sorting domain-containing protein [Chitinophagaceae bacterium]
NNSPAVAWFREGTFNDLMYCIASDSTGSSWGTVQTVVSTFSSGWYPQLLTINGHPAIFYNYNAAFADSIRYIRATDSTGSSWGAAVTIDYSEFQPAFAAFVTDGKPVLFFDANDDQYFVAANDTIGSSWGTRDTLSYDFNLQPGSMKVATKDIRTYVIGKSSTTGNHHLYVYTEGNVWNGSTWSAGTPDSTSTAIIKSSTAPASFSVKDLYINDGFSLNTGTSATATIYGSLYNYGDGVSGQGTLTFTANGGAELIGDTVEHEGAVIVESGCTLTTNSKLRLTSDASNTGRIGESDGTINGDVYVQRYMPGKRCFRFYGHPFSSSIALSQLTDEIDITGSGGSTNGFTNTGSNNPSAFWFDVTAADTSTTGANPGWTAFTSATSADWDQYELLRLLVRGAKGEGLNGGAYTPSAATFEAVGAINQGTQVVTLAKGSNTEFVGCGNPFPSPVNMQNITRGSNVGANYYAWDATSGASGAYVTNAWTLSYNLPAYSAFFTTVSANSNNTLTFEEQDKVATGVGLFKTTGPNDWVELYIYDSTTKWDRLLINLNSNGMEVEDQLDGKKLYNPGLDFFTLSKDDVRLAVDVRPYDDGKSIPLGLTAYNRYNKYVIRTGMFSIPAGTKLVLHDKYLNKKEELKVGSEYWFDVTGDTASQGNNRFEINMVGKPTGVIETIRKPQMFLAPNPANKNVKVSFAQLDGEAQIQLISITGQTVFKQVVPEQTGSVTIPLHNVPNGIYIVELRSNNATFTEKLIKK